MPNVLKLRWFQHEWCQQSTSHLGLKSATRFRHHFWGAIEASLASVLRCGKAAAGDGPHDLGLPDLPKVLWICVR